MATFEIHYANGASASTGTTGGNGGNGGNGGASSCNWATGSSDAGCAPANVAARTAAAAARVIRLTGGRRRASPCPEDICRPS